MLFFLLFFNSASRACRELEAWRDAGLLIWRIEFSMPQLFIMRSFALIAALVFGAWFSELSVLTPVIRPLLIAMLLVTFLKLDVKKLKPGKGHLVLLALNVFFSLGGWWLFERMGQHDLAIAAFLVGISPTATNVPVMLGFLERKVEFGVTALVLGNIGACISIPLLLPLVSSNPAEGLAWKLASSMLVILGTPALLACLARWVYPAVKNLPAKLANWQFGAWNLALVLVAARSSAYVKEHSVPWSILLSLALLAAVMCALQFGVGGLLGRLQREDLRQEMAQACGQKNTILTIYVAIAHDFPLAALALTFYVLFHNSWNVWQLQRHARVKHLQKSLLEQEKRELFAEES